MPIFPSQWSENTNLTGNSQFVIDSAGTIWLVSNTDNGAAIFSSVDNGVTFVSQQALQGTVLGAQNVVVSAGLTTQNVALDPALCIDSEGTLHFIGQTNDPGIVGTIQVSSNNINIPISVVKFSYVPSTQTLLGPFTLVDNEIIGSDYDIVALNNGNCFAVLSTVSATTETILGLEIAPDGTIVHSDELYTTPLLSGLRMGSVSLSTPDGIEVEIYLGQHNKLVTFGDFTVTLALILRNGSVSPPTYSDQTVLTQFQARHVDDRLTVTARGQERFLSQCFYTQSGLNLIGNMILGYLPSGGTWNFKSIYGTPTASLVEPTFSVSASEVILAYIIKDLTQNPAIDGTIQLVDVTPATWTFSNRTDFYTSTAFYIRGTKGNFSSTLKWGFIGQLVAAAPDVLSGGGYHDGGGSGGHFGVVHGGGGGTGGSTGSGNGGSGGNQSTPVTAVAFGQATYYTGFNAPPVAVIAPLTLTANRGTVYQFAASDSYDPNSDHIEFVWSLTDTTGKGILIASGATATLEVPLTIGPAAHTMTVSVAVTDYDINGNALHSPVIASTIVTVPFVAAPTIVPLNGQTIGVERNVPVPTLLLFTTTNAPGTTLTFSWAQITGGTPLRVSNSGYPPYFYINTFGSGPTGVANQEYILISTSGASLAGETDEFEITISDGINAPVSLIFTLIVAPSTALGNQTLFLAQSSWPGTISQRNSPLGWSTPHISTILADFQFTKRSFLVRGVSVTTFIGLNEVLVYGWDPTIQSLLLRYIFLPNASETIVDAIQTETDYTIILTSAGKLLQFLGTAPVLSTDNPSATIDLTAITSLSFTNLITLPSYADQRIIALFGPDGCFLLQIQNSTFSVQQSLLLNTASGLIYGGENIKWVRTREVESLYTGQLLIGSMDSNGNTYETLVDMASKQVIQIWNASVLRNQFVTTGEMLFQPESTYNGIPTAPVLNQPLINELSNILTWTQERPDLVTGYLIQYSTNGGSFNPLTSVTSGEVLVYIANLPGGNTYSFRIQATSLDGNSSWSNVVTT